MKYSSCTIVIIAAAMLSCCQLSSGPETVNWPSFRGPNASGIALGGRAPLTWSVPDSSNILWKTPIPGLAHSSPVVWGDRVYLTTAISSGDDPEMKVGLYGSIDPVENEVEHTFNVLCLDKKNGELIWERTACEGVPEVKRHPKSTHANSTPATDGSHVVAFFGSEGLYCYTAEGDLLWEKDFGVLDAGFFLAPEAQWGFGSSPIIYEGTVVVQCDVQDDSFLAVYDIETGEERWRTIRNDVPTWGTPTINAAADPAQIIVNGWKHAGAYNFETGEPVWKITGGGDIPVPTPVIAHDMVFINSAHGPGSPIYAVSLDAEGDISLGEDDTTNAGIVWSVRRGGAYMQTPLIYGDHLYNLRGNGYLTCYEAGNGTVIYREKVGTVASFSASGVAADGKLYFASEQGDIYVVKAGPEFELLAANPMDDICMATPAISEGVLYIRTQHFLTAVGKGRT